MIRLLFVLIAAFSSLLSSAQTPDSTELRSEPISFSNPVISLTFVTIQRSYNPFYMSKMEFREPLGLRVKGGGFNSHRFLLNGIPVNNRLYNDIPLTDGTITLDNAWLSGRTPGQSSGVFVITQPIPGKIISSTLELSGGTYFSSDNDLYPQRTKLDNLGNKNLKYSVSGPVPFLENLSFSTEGLFNQDGGYLSGVNQYKTWEGLTVNNSWIPPSGDSSGVMMNDFNRRSLSFRLLWERDIVSTDFFILYNRKAASYYSFEWILTPVGNLRHYQEQIISGLTTTFKWNDSFNQTLKLSYQPTQTWGYLAPDINGTAYSRPYPYGGIDIDLFYSNTGGYENRRYRYHDNLFLFSLENTYKWNDYQESILLIQSENWWYFEEKGYVYNKSTSSFPPQMYFSGYTFNNHPSLYSLTASHRLNFSLANLPIEAEAGFRIESYKSDGREYTNDTTYKGTKLKQYVSDENPDAINEFLPFFSGNAGFLESLRLSWSFRQSVDWPSYTDLYSGEYLKSFEPDLSTFIGNGSLKPDKWETAQVGAEWNPLNNLLFTLDVYRRSSKRLKFQDYRYGLYSVGTSNNGDVAFQGIHARIYYSNQIPENPIINTFSVSVSFLLQEYDIPEGSYGIFSRRDLGNKFFEEYYWITPTAFSVGVHFETTWDMTGTIVYKNRSGEYYFTNYLLIEATDRPIGNGYHREQMPSNSQIDLNLEQKLPIESLESSLFISVENLFDKRNLLTVYPQTGKADLKDDKVFYSRFTNEPLVKTYRKTGAENPDFYTPPRKITAGIRIKF